MTIFSGACSVTSCPFNLGAKGITCGWLRNGRGRCHHPLYREAWALGHELEQAQEGDPAPVILALAVETGTLVAGCAEMHDLPARPASLTWRVTAASKPMDAARARQMLLDLGEV